MLPRFIVYLAIFHYFVLFAPLDGYVQEQKKHLRCETVKPRKRPEDVWKKKNPIESAQLDPTLTTQRRRMIAEDTEEIAHRRVAR